MAQTAASQAGLICQHILEPKYDGGDDNDEGGGGDGDGKDGGDDDDGDDEDGLGLAEPSRWTRRI